MTVENGALDTPAPLFMRYVGIDYSGAATPNASLSGLRVYVATQDEDPHELNPPPSPRKYWTRRGVAEWLLAILAEDVPTVVGIDHGFSFPLAYFEKHSLDLDWTSFLEDFQRHWPTDADNVWVDFIRDGAHGKGHLRTGETRWRRVCEKRAGAAKSVFHFDAQGSVAKSTHSGLPWLLRIRRELGERVHFWPFDGWLIPARRSAIAEVYPALWSRKYDRSDRTSDQHDAYSVSKWLRDADRDGLLGSELTPVLTADDLVAASVEGWILGVGAAGRDRTLRARVQAATGGDAFSATAGFVQDSASPPKPSLEINVAEEIRVRARIAEPEVWRSYNYAPEWFQDARTESRSAGRGARRREIVFAVAAVESYFFEWVRDAVLQRDFNGLLIYFPTNVNRPLKERIREVCHKLNVDGHLRELPDFQRREWQQFWTLVDLRNGLVHARSSRPEKNKGQPQDQRPSPSPQYLDEMSGGLATGSAASAMRLLCEASRTPIPSWLKLD